MRIGFFTDSYSLPIRNGVEAVIESSKSCLERMGHEVFIYAPNYPDSLDDGKNIFRFKSLRFIQKPEMRIAFPAVYEKKLNEILKFKLDIVHAHSPFSLGFLGKLIAKTQKIPIVYTHHTHYPEYVKAYLKEKWVLPHLAKKFTATFCNYMDTVVAPSLKVKNLLLESGVTSPIEIVHNGIDLSKFKMTKGAPEKIKEALGIESDKKVLLFLGRVCKEKNIGFLIKAFADLSQMRDDVVFVIVGDGPELDALKYLALSMGVADRVIFPGFISIDEKTHYFGMADLFVFSSFTEMHPIVILEALASALPVIALDDTALYGSILDGENGYFVSASATPKDFASKVSGLLDSPNLLKEFGKKSLKLAENFSEMANVHKLEALYNNLRSSKKEALASKV